MRQKIYASDPLHHGQFVRALEILEETFKVKCIAFKIFAMVYTVTIFHSLNSAFCETAFKNTDLLKWFTSFQIEQFVFKIDFTLKFLLCQCEDGWKINVAKFKMRTQQLALVCRLKLGSCFVSMGSNILGLTQQQKNCVSTLKPAQPVFKQMQTLLLLIKFCEESSH